MTTSKYPKPSDDLISNVFDILPDKILQLLPIREAARTSVLSKKWRSTWLSLKRLIFNADFFKDGSVNLQQYSNIISGILLNHDGPVHEFALQIPQGTNEKCLNLNQWLSFLSKYGVRVIEIRGIRSMPISSNIFWCSELIHLHLFNLTIQPPPYGFSGFPKLQHLYLSYIQFSREDIFPGLMAKCLKLASLWIINCGRMSDIVIDAPNLEMIIIFCLSECKSIAFRDVRNLKNVQVRASNSLRKLPTIEAIDSFNNLASSRQLQCIEFNGVYFKFLAADGFNRALPITFNYLSELSLYDLSLSDPGVLGNIFDMLEGCSYIKELFISILATENDNNHQRLYYSKVYKSTHLVEVKIRGITGAAMELQLIEYLWVFFAASQK